MQATGSSYACDFVHCFATLYGAAWLVHGGIALQQCRPLLTTARHFLVLRLGLVEPTWEEVNGDDPSPKVFDEFFAMDPDNEFGMVSQREVHGVVFFRRQEEEVGKRGTIFSVGRWVAWLTLWLVQDIMCCSASLSGFPANS